MSETPKTAKNYSKLTIHELDREIGDRNALISNKLDRLHDHLPPDHQRKTAELKSEFQELVHAGIHLRERLEPIPQPQTS